jgi:hypothetical protein
VDIVRDLHSRAAAFEKTKSQVGSLSVCSMNMLCVIARVFTILAAVR